MTQPNSTPRLRPVIRVFVSSTFSDLKPERNALQAQVFPRLEQLCAQNGFQFQAIDLRWGVSSEAGLDHRTMRIFLSYGHDSNEKLVRCIYADLKNLVMTSGSRRPRSNLVRSGGVPSASLSLPPSVI